MSKVALAAIQGELTITELAQKYDVVANQITQWKTQMKLLPPLSLTFSEVAGRGGISVGSLYNWRSQPQACLPDLP